MDLTNEINLMISEKKMDEQGVIDLIRDMLVSAYKRKFGTDENVIIKFYENDLGEENRCVDMYSRKEIVREEDWFDPVREISIEEVKELTTSPFDVGDLIEIQINPKSFEYSAVQSARQRSQQVVKEYNTDRVYMDAKALEGRLVLGMIKQKKPANDDYIVDLGLDENADVIFPLRGQSPRESYEIGEKLKFYVESVEKTGEASRRASDFQVPERRRRREGVRVVVSRSSKDFVRSLIESEVPEVSSGEVEIKSLVRHAGVRTKIAVDTNKEQDPVLAVVGKAGARIQAIMTECDGEKMDVIRYSSDPLAFIANALIPAQVQRVVMIDPSSKRVVAIVEDSQLGIAIGQGGVNVRLANQLCDWNIEVKTQDQFNEMAETLEIYKKVDALFKSEDGKGLTNAELGIDPDDTPLTELDIDDQLIKKLHGADIWSVEEFFEYGDEELFSFGLTAEEIEEIKGNVEFSEEDEEFECPICHSMLPAGTSVCPNCNTEFEFE